VWFHTLVADTVLDNEVTEKQRKKVARLEKENAAMKVKIAKAKSNAGSNAGKWSIILIGPCAIFFSGPSRERDTEDDIESEDFDVPANFLSSIRSLGVVSATPAKPLRPQQIGAASAPVPSSVDGNVILFSSPHILNYWDKGLQTTPRPSAVDETAIELPAPPVRKRPIGMIPAPSPPHSLPSTPAQLNKQPTGVIPIPTPLTADGIYLFIFHYRIFDFLWQTLNLCWWCPKSWLSALANDLEPYPGFGR
jgi:hypothetical protein